MLSQRAIFAPSVRYRLSGGGGPIETGEKAFYVLRERERERAGGRLCVPNNLSPRPSLAFFVRWTLYQIIHYMPGQIPILRSLSPPSSSDWRESRAPGGAWLIATRSSTTRTRSRLLLASLSVLRPPLLRCRNATAAMRCFPNAAHADATAHMTSKEEALTAGAGCWCHSSKIRNGTDIGDVASLQPPRPP